MTAKTRTRQEPVDWRALWASGDLGRFIFISLGILLHATNETMIATVMPGMVADIGGVELVGWSLAIYEVGSIVAGAIAGRLVSYMALRTNMAGSALVYGFGALICALAPSMPWFLAGRLFEGFGGGALVALAFVSVERLFPRNIWPQLFAIISVVWGVAAFGGPLIGAVVSEHLSWRWAFGLFAVAGSGMAGIAYLVLTSPAARFPALAGDRPPFPLATVACIAVAIMFVAMAGVGIEPLRSSIFLGLGLAGIACFFILDARRPHSRLFPQRPLDPRQPLGNGLVMIAALSVGTSTFPVYGPLILTTLHGVSLMTTGYLIAAEAVAWSVLSILVANARPEHERAIILTGVLMIASGIAGFAWSMPSGNLWAVLVCAVLQGGGFGIAWPFVTRMIVASARESERAIASSAVPTMQRIGYAIGAAVAGIIANASGFAQGLSGETAASVASWLYLAFVPFGVIGAIEAIILLRRSPDPSAPDA